MNDYDKEIDKLFVGQHSDDCAINVTGEGFPCICWVAEAKAAISALLVSARKDELEHIPGRRATENKYIVDISDIKDRLAELSKPEGENHGDSK